MVEIVRILRKFDRLNANTVFPTEQYINYMLDKYGYLSFVVFVCPKMRGKYLITETKELYMPTEETQYGLFYPRVPKIKSLAMTLWEIGIPSRVTFLIGDNTFERCKGPVLGITLNKALMDERRELYQANLFAQLTRVFTQLIEVSSLGLMNIGVFEGKMRFPQQVIREEVAFQRVSLIKYYGILDPKQADVIKMAELMLRSYAEEGFLAEALDGILIATEGDSDVNTWVRRVEMLQMGGAKFSVIYPYIRTETLTKY